MTAKSLFNINYLTFAGDGTIHMPPFTITNNPKLRNKFLVKDILINFGENLVHYPPQNVYAYCEFEFDTENKPLEQILTELSIQTRIHCNGLMNFLNFLWFAKDNSISLGTAWVSIPEIEKCIVELTSNYAQRFSIIILSLRDLFPYLNDIDLKDGATG